MAPIVQPYTPDARTATTSTTAPATKPASVIRKGICAEYRHTSFESAGKHGAMDRLSASIRSRKQYPRCRGGLTKLQSTQRPRTRRSRLPHGVGFFDQNDQIAVEKLHHLQKKPGRAQPVETRDQSGHRRCGDE